MNYLQTIDFLYSQLPVFHRVGAAAYKANLNNTIALSEYLGKPENKFNSIHIAGTNGKGSVACMLASVLKEAGYKTGLCTSPHLRDFRERIRINGKMIPKSYVVEFVKNHKEFFGIINPSFFEMFVALAFDYFANQEVDIAVVETGMGGRLDSTNIIKPELSVITNIGLDHTAFLGNTLEKIAGEKAGIIKRNTPVVIGRKQKLTKQVFEKKAKDLNSELFYAEDFYSVLSVNNTWKYNRFWLDVNLNNHGDKRYLSDQLGPYQPENIVTTLAAINVLNKNSKFFLPEKSITEGLKKTKKNSGIEGRWQIEGKSPRIIFDTGHNTDGLNITMSYLKKLSYNKLHFVLGMVDDKDINGSLKLLPKNALYYFCRPDVPRGLSVEKLQEAANNLALKGLVFDSVKSAFEKAKATAATNDLIFVGGSTFVVAEVI